MAEVRRTNEDDFCGVDIVRPYRFVISSSNSCFEVNTPDMKVVMNNRHKTTQTKGLEICLEAGPMACTLH